MMSRPRSWWAAAAAIVGCAVPVMYVLLVVRQSASDDPIESRPAVVVLVLLLALAGLTVFGAVSTRARPRRASLAAAAIGWFVLGYVALWSVGILLILAGLLAVLALVREATRIHEPR